MKNQIQSPLLTSIVISSRYLSVWIAVVLLLITALLVAPETLSRTNLGSLTHGSRVNLERPVTPSTRLSGHIVQGHVDATAELLSIESLGEGNWWIKLRAPQALDRYMVEKGSITLDGISLTIARLEPGPIVGLTIIPHTLANTTLASAKPGAPINVEVDVLAKHVEKLLART